MEDSYKDATNEPHGYLMIDLKQETNDMCRSKTKIFPSDGYCTVQVPTKTFKYAKNQQIPLSYK